MGKLEWHCRKEFIAIGKWTRASYEMLFNLVSETWKQVVKNELIIQGFSQCGYIYWNGDYSELHSMLQMIIDNQEVPSEVLEEVWNFIKEMEDLDREKVAQGECRNDEYEDEDDELVIEDQDAKMPMMRVMTQVIVLALRANCCTLYCAYRVIGYSN